MKTKFVDRIVRMLTDVEYRHRLEVPTEGIASIFMATSIARTGTDLHVAIADWLLHSKRTHFAQEGTQVIPGDFRIRKFRLTMFVQTFGYCACVPS